MSAKAKMLLKQAIQLIEEEDGTSEIGCYRDVVTEVLHLANKKFCAGGPYSGPDMLKHWAGGPYSGPDMLKHWICSMGFDVFEEELEIIEAGKVEAIPDEQLPLHNINEFIYPASKARFEERLKGEDHGKETSPLHNLRKKNPPLHNLGNKVSRRDYLSLQRPRLQG
jgi:hypothetical protein